MKHKKLMIIISIFVLSLLLFLFFFFTNKEHSSTINEGNNLEDENSNEYENNDNKTEDDTNNTEDDNNTIDETIFENSEDIITKNDKDNLEEIQNDIINKLDMDYLNNNSNNENIHNIEWEGELLDQITILKPYTIMELQFFNNDIYNVYEQNDIDNNKVNGKLNIDNTYNYYSNQNNDNNAEESNDTEETTNNNENITDILFSYRNLIDYHIKENILKYNLSSESEIISYGDNKKGILLPNNFFIPKDVLNDYGYDIENNEITQNTNINDNYVEILLPEYMAYKDTQLGLDYYKVVAMLLGEGFINDTEQDFLEIIPNVDDNFINIKTLENITDLMILDRINKRAIIIEGKIQNNKNISLNKSLIKTILYGNADLLEETEYNQFVSEEENDGDYTFGVHEAIINNNIEIYGLKRENNNINISNENIINILDFKEEN